MHIPDPFLSTPVWAGMAVAAAPAVGWAARKANETMDEHRVPLLGVMGAFVFAAQMVNFPIGVGTSSHLLGGALLSMTVGPWAAAIVMTAIVAVQALLFADGGLLAMGANVFNMALAGVAAGYLPYQLVGQRMPRLGAFLGGFFSLIVSATLAVFELWLSGRALPTAALALSGVLFLAAAAAEGAITVLALHAIGGMNPAWVRAPKTWDTRTLRWSVALAALALVTAGMLMTSALPDGLESLATRAGFAASEQNLTSPFAGYETSWISGAWLRQATAGLLGLVTIFLLVSGAARLLARRTR